jgi:hypothetical protein
MVLVVKLGRVAFARVVIALQEHRGRHRTYRGVRRLELGCVVDRSEVEDDGMSPFDTETS